MSIKLSKKDIVYAVTSMATYTAVGVSIGGLALLGSTAVLASCGLNGSRLKDTVNMLISVGLASICESLVLETECVGDVINNFIDNKTRDLFPDETE